MEYRIFLHDLLLGLYHEKAHQKTIKQSFLSSNTKEEKEWIHFLNTRQHLLDQNIPLHELLSFHKMEHWSKTCLGYNQCMQIIFALGMRNTYPTCTSLFSNAHLNDECYVDACLRICGALLETPFHKIEASMMHKMHDITRTMYYIFFSYMILAIKTEISAQMLDKCKEMYTKCKQMRRKHKKNMQMRNKYASYQCLCHFSESDCEQLMELCKSNTILREKVSALLELRKQL